MAKKFAVTYKEDGNVVKKLPIGDKAHADNAAARLNQTDMPASKKAAAKSAIEAAQRRFGTQAAIDRAKGKKR
ncbi:MAG TPA: hypothetical protein VMI11_03435 [Actinomycetes bacterium]|nr:hypothetical protein [Actinomycetes bacterium]